jgi:hypothetical protein
VVETDKKFWSTKDPGQKPFAYQAGVGGVIKGWDQGCLGMAVGEKRVLQIPAHEGYGVKGFPAWGISPGSTLQFTLECLEAEGAEGAIKNPPLESASGKKPPDVPALGANDDGDLGGGYCTLA